MPKMQFGTAQTYFSTVEKEIAPESPTWNYQSIAKGYTAPPAVPGKIDIPTWKSELYFEYHRGVMTTQANHKRNMREAEEEVLNAEKWSSLAWLDGRCVSGERADGRLEEGALQPVPRSGGGLGHRHHLQGRAEGLRRGALVDERDLGGRAADSGRARGDECEAGECDSGAGVQSAGLGALRRSDGEGAGAAGRCGETGDCRCGAGQERRAWRMLPRATRRPALWN